MTNERQDQTLFHAEYRVRIEIRVTVHEHVRRDALISGRGDDEVDVRRAHRVTPERSEHGPDRSVAWNRIRGWFDGPEEIKSVPAGHELSPKIHRGLSRVLHVVEAIEGRLPDIEQRAFDRNAFF